MIRLLKMLFEDPSMMYMIPSLVMLIFSFIVARYCVRKFQNGASNLMMIGVVIQGVQFVYVQLLNTLILQTIGYDNATLYYGISILLFVISEGLFLFGIWKLVKGFAESKEEKTGGMGDLFLKK